MLADLTMITNPTITLKRHQRRGIQRPVIHILMSDGRITEFKDRAIVIPDSDSRNPDDQHVYAVLVNRAGEPFETPDGAPAVVAVPVLTLGIKTDPNKLLTYADLVKRMGLSQSSVQRLVRDGDLPTPTKISKRAVRFREGDVAAAIARLKK